VRTEDVVDVFTGDVPLLSVKNLSRTYPGAVTLLQDASFDIWSGEFVYITGPSGAGKTTLLKILYRAEMAESGRILFCGQDITRLEEGSVPFLRRNVGIVFQDFRLVDWLTVGENVAIPLEILGIPSDEATERIKDVLEKVGLKNYENVTAGKLSGGEQQRVAMARAVVSRPPILLADEPTGNLDQVSATAVMDLMESINDEGTAVVVATHDELLLTSRPHRTVGLMGGRVVEVDYKNSQRHRKVVEALASEAA
jgi:cell division transport system ATP-binding protein